MHLEEARKGNVPEPGTPYTIFVRLDKDRPNIYESGQLTRDAFMQDDRVLMITGSPESREALAKMLFGRKEEGGEGWTSVGSYHKIRESYHSIREVAFNAKAKGRLVFLSNENFGLDGYKGFSNIGRFVAVDIVCGKNASQGIVQPTPEQTLAVSMHRQ